MSGRFTLPREHGHVGLVHSSSVAIIAAMFRRCSLKRIVKNMERWSLGAGPMTARQ